MSKFGELGRKFGRPSYQVFYGEAKPPGKGWLRVSSGKVGKLTTDAKWYRDYAFVGTDKPTDKKEDDANTLGWWGKMKAVAKGAFFGSKEKAEAKKPKTVGGKGGLAVYKVGDRVVTDKGSYAYVDTVVDGSTYIVRHPGSGKTEHKSLDQLKGKENYDMSRFAVGDIVTTKDGEGRVTKNNAKTHRVTVKYDGTNKSQDYYPEQIIGAGGESDSDVKDLDKAVTEHFSDTHRFVVEALARAKAQGRHSATIPELFSDLNLHHSYVNTADVLAAMKDIGKVYPKHVSFEEGKNLIRFGTATQGLPKLAQKIGAEIRDVPFGWNPDPGDAVFVKSGMAVDFVSGTRATIKVSDGIDADVELSHGVIESMSKGRFRFKVVDKEGSTFFLTDKDIEVPSADMSLYDLMTVNGKVVKPDPLNPDLYGSVVRNNFWHLRDRIVSRDITPGDMVKSMPFAVKSAEGKYTESTQPGQVIDVMPDTGLVRVQFGDGRILDVSPRQLQLERQVESAEDLYDISRVRRQILYGGIFGIGDKGPAVEFGYDQDEKKTGKTTITRVVFNNAKDFQDNYSAFFKRMEYGAMDNLMGMMSKSSKDIFSDSKRPPFVPQAALMRTLQALYPHMDSVSMRQSTEAKTGKYIVEIGVGKAVGKSLPMSHVLMGVFPDRPDAKALDAQAYDNAHHRESRIDVTTDGNSIYMRIGEDLRKAPMAAIFRPLAPKGKREATLYDVISANKTRLREIVAPHDEALYNALSRFIYDPRGKRFVSDMSDYVGTKNAVLEVAGKLYPGYKVMESADGAWWYGAGSGPVTDMAKSVQSNMLGVVRARSDDTLADIPGFAHEKGYKLFKGQRSAVNFLTAPGQKAALLAFDQGTGKTAIDLAAILKRHQQGEVKKALIVVPASIVGNWKKEMSEWSSGESEKYTRILMGSGRDKVYKEMFSSSPPLITVTSYDTFVQDYKELAKANFDMLVLDEAQAIKNVDTKRSTLIKAAFSDVRYRVASTGTPVENSPEDLFSIMEFLSPETFGDYRKFTNDFIEYDTLKKTTDSGTVTTTRIPIGIKNAAVLRTKMIPLMLRATKKQMAADMEEEAAVYDKDGNKVPLMGSRTIIPWPTMKKQDDGTYVSDMSSDPRNAEYIIPQDVSHAPEYWRLHKLAARLMIQQTGNPLVKLIRMQQVADDPATFGKSLGGEFAQYAEEFAKFDEQNPDGSYKHVHPKRDKMLSIMKQHMADPTNGKMIVFSQSTMVLDKIKQWVYSDPEIRKALHVTDKAYNEARLTGNFDKLRGALTFKGGMSSSTGHKEAAALAKRYAHGDDFEDSLTPVQRDKLNNQRAVVVERFQTDPSVKILLATDAAQTGLTLTAANAVINYNLGYNPKAMDQRVDRAHRIDRKRIEAGGRAYDVTAYNIIADKTADMFKMPPLAWRSAMFDVLIDGTAEDGRIVCDRATVKTDQEIIDALAADPVSVPNKRKKSVREAMLISAIRRRYGRKLNPRIIRL